MKIQYTNDRFLWWTGGLCGYGVSFFVFHTNTNYLFRYFLASKPSIEDLTDPTNDLTAVLVLRKEYLLVGGSRSTAEQLKEITC
jgi:hypothetical protein